jgi:hypothetical protein
MERRISLYSFIVLVLIAALLSGAAVGVTFYEIGVNNHKFCQLIHTATTTVVPKPADPKANPSRERSYEGYMQAVRLGHSLGCPL